MSHAIRSLWFVALVCLSAAVSAVIAQDAAGPPPPAADTRDYPPVLLPPATTEALARVPEPRAAATYLEWSRVVYYANAGGNWDIYHSDDAGENAFRLTRNPAIDVQPDLIRGGTHVVFTSNADGDFDLYVMELATGLITRLLDTDADEFMPVWSPDGSRVAFQSDRDGQPEVYVINADGSGLTRLTANPDFDGHPSWSPDGHRLAFSSRRNGQYRIWVMNADGGAPTQLSGQPGGLYPAWSPGGNFIAYSADGDGDGRLELWLMNADGAIQYQLHRDSGTVDLMPRSWAPDGSMLAYTTAYYAYDPDRDEWLIFDSRMDRISIGASYGIQIGAAAGSPFAPAWGTLDNQAPVAAVIPLPPVVPNPFTVSWDAHDLGPSGLALLQVQISVDDGPWTIWLDAAPGNHATYLLGRGGHRYAFRTRAVDNSHNDKPWPDAPEAITLVEALPPVTALAPLPVYSRIDREFGLTLSGFDPGHSDFYYLMQWRRGDELWADWTDSWTDDESVFDPAARDVRPGETAAFRIRGTDAAFNVEPWPPDPGNATTTFYNWGVAGKVIDNAGAPVGGAAITTEPATMGAALSGAGGDYARYLAAAGAVTAIDWAKPGYGGLPATAFDTSAGEATADVVLEVALPPADDVVLDGDFEAAGWGAWAVGGSLPPVLSPDARHTGAQGALLASRPALFGPADRLSATQAEPESDVRLSLSGGAATLVWTEGNPDEDMTLRAAWRGPDGVWSPTVTVLEPVRWGFDMATGHDGRLHVVARTEGGLVYLRQTGDSTWAAPEPVPNSLPTQEQQLLLGPDGSLHLFWPEYADELTLRYSRRSPGGGWSAPAIVAAFDNATLAGFGAAVSPDGGLTLIYLERNYEDEIGSRLWAKERRPNGTWMPAIVLQNGGGNGIDLPAPPVAGADGRVHLLWQWYSSYDPYRTDVYYSLKEGSDWSGPQLALRKSDLADFAVGPSGEIQALVGWRGTLRYTTRLAGGSWLFPRLVPGSTSGSVRLLIDGDGLPHVIRGGYPGEYTAGDMQYTRMTASGAWTDPLPVATGFDKNYGPDAALDAGGNIHLAWLVEDAQTAATRADVAYAGPPATAIAGEALLSQTVTVPANAAHPVLSFFYGFGGATTAATALEVVAEPENGPVVSRNLPPTPGSTGDASRHDWLDLSAYAGETVVVTFRLHQAAGEPAAWAVVDDVSLGTARGDVWLAGAGDAALPSETVQHELVAGNRGGVAAEGVVLTYSLPPELTFLSAAPAPDGFGPLRWELGSLPPGATRAIRLTAAVKASAAPFQTVSGTATLILPGELETHNNTVGIPTRLERSIFLPAAMR